MAFCASSTPGVSKVGFLIILERYVIRHACSSLKSTLKIRVNFDGVSYDVLGFVPDIFRTVSSQHCY